MGPRAEDPTRKVEPEVAERYEAPAAEDLDVTDGPAVTVAGAAQTTVRSDRALKEQISVIDPSAVLDGVTRIEISRWSYTGEPSVRHIGPMAQDFAAAFSVGNDDRHIHAVDANGVALASIQALRGLIDRQAEEIRGLRAEIEELRDT